ncbi:glycosyltransferase family 1 protein [Bacillus sp. C1-1]|nr:glycosyltransferase family 1 protein [Bacillus sp. C1-1]
MKSTLHILTLSKRAGLEMMFLNYLKNMRKEDPELLDKQVVVSLSSSQYFIEEFNNLGAKLITIDRKNKNSFKTIKLLIELCKTNNIQVIYGQNFVGNFFGAILKLRFKNKRFVAHEHGTSWNVNGYQKLLTIFWITMAENIICNSEAALILLNKKFKAKESKLTVIKNGVPIAKDLYNQTNYTKDHFKLLFVGRLEKVKSPITLLEVMETLIVKNSNYHLDILGDGPEYKSLQKKVSENGLEEYITFHGNIEDVSIYMKNASWLILPSIREPLGNVIIESALNKTPAIGTAVDGIPEVISHNNTGYLVKPSVKNYNNIGVEKVVNPLTSNLEEPLSPLGIDIANYILETSKDKTLEFGENAFVRANKLFSFKRYYDEINNIIYQRGKKS